MSVNLEMIIDFTHGAEESGIVKLTSAKRKTPNFMLTLMCNPPTKKHQLKVEISRKLLQGEFL